LRKKVPHQQLTIPPPKRKPHKVAIGCDVSMSSIAVCAIGKDGVVPGFRGPEFKTIRWNKGDHYFERCKTAAKGHEVILDVIGALGIASQLNEVHIAIEEPFPMGMMRGMQSSWIKQQCQIQGIFMGSLLRWGWENVYEINNQRWKNVVKNDGFELPRGKEGKFVVKKWAMQSYGLPDLPDLINSPHGKIPKPETSRAKPEQPEDIYDACAIMAWMESEINLQAEED
jgi:hypothetical protein